MSEVDGGYIIFYSNQSICILHSPTAFMYGINWKNQNRAIIL